MPDKIIETHDVVPYTIGDRDESNRTLPIIGGTKWHEIAYVSPKAFYNDNQRANAEFIVRACNNHDYLLAALKDILAIDGETRSDMYGLNQFETAGERKVFDAARLAIAKATE